MQQRKKHFLGVLAIAVFTAALIGSGSTPPKKRTCKTVYPKFDYQSYKRVAVIGDCDKINPLLEETLVGFDMSPYTVIERSRLDSILREQGLGTTGALDDESITRMGKSPGVDALIITQCRGLGDDASMRMIDTTSGRVLSVKTTYHYNSYYRTYESDDAAWEFYKAVGPYERCS